VNTSAKFIGLGAACVACCALPVVGVALAGTAFASLVSTYAGWIAAAGILSVAGILLLRNRSATPSQAGCGCSSACQVNPIRDAETSPIACTLSPGAYGERVAWIQNLARDALISARRDDLVLHLSYAAHAAPRVREMVEKEKACCAFLTFAFSGDVAGIHLKITAPEEAREAADVLFAHFAPLPTALQGKSQPNHREIV
jgi:hypothetical protein